MVQPSNKKKIILKLHSSLLDNLERMDPEKYEVSQEDALRCRRKTTGIVEFVCNPEIDGKKHIIKLVDVGGQRNERKKWMHCKRNF
jgi:guanine nucleotide-binding protein G(i) subunit alpha